MLRTAFGSSLYGRLFVGTDIFTHNHMLLIFQSRNTNAISENQEDMYTKITFLQNISVRSILKKNVWA